MASKGNKKRFLFLIHLLGWGMVFALPFFFSTKNGESVTWAHYVGYASAILSFVVVFYVNYFYLIDRVLVRKNLTYFILLNVGMILLISVLQDWWHTYYYTHCLSHVAENRPPRPPRMVMLLRDFAMLGLTAALSVAVRLTGNWYRIESERKELEKGKMEAELKNLKSQLNPHFLFNTLNNIYSLIAYSPEQAQYAVLDLSKLLRYVLYDNNQTYVSLRKEAEFVRNYIALMKIRLPEHVVVTDEIETDSDVMIAPLLFIVLIENAFKHGVSLTAPSFIHIVLSAGKDEVVCRIENSFFPKTEQDKSGSGIGLENLSKRLALLYPGKYSLTLEKVDEQCVAELKLSIR